MLISKTIIFSYLTRQPYTPSSHGCTVGSLSADSLFYLQTRGIGKKEASALLTYAFANTVLESVKIPALSAYINRIIAEKLGVTVDF